MEKLIIKDSVSGTGNYSYSSTEYFRQLEIVNDDSAHDISCVVDGKTFIIKPDESLIENFISFNTVGITATGAWRMIVRA